MFTLARKQLFSATVAGLLLVGVDGWAASAQTHRVVAGDSLWSIAKQYDTRVDTLKELNGLENAKIRVGQLLKISAAPDEPKKAEPQKPAPSAPEQQQKTEPQKRAPAAPADKPKTDSAKPSADDAAVLDDDSKRPTYEGEARGQLEPVPAWVLERPSDKQTTATASEALQPCRPADEGFGQYSPWQKASEMGELLMPKTSPLDADGTFDLVIHFHGRELVRKQFVKVMTQEVLLAVDLGIGSKSYEEAFADPTEFRKLLHSVERDVAKKYGVQNTRVGRVALSAWSAGYGAIGKIIDQPFGEERVDAVFLLDGLHSGYWGNNLNAQKLAPYVRFSERAAKRERLMFVSHSAITPRGYASTTETARYLIWKNGGEPKPGKRRAADPMGLELSSRYSEGSFHVRGFRGQTTADHCAQLAIIRDVLRIHLRRRWEKKQNDESVAKND